ncbi:actin-like ATPase domain-containing protein [Suhomyces tanzawaensis NRRL Y-17324]|uniref:Actin-like ATPase domain-containing protein n=1 Tax=Suhomyces tanzawaensis NRRL Y-17324 TaxID=984487 RepID=A0A1E4SBA2_9ASCO|nr:actin-like ATPase domain-containing protein [Suhomyces tanzawaensis NRRL Y-17324]ODV76783.1 actin-like ATPase domain-containing protein [Suhomyces tanzawaensis NRRL Y-17324]
MPFYKEDSYLVVYPGSTSTVFSFGLQDLLAPPQYKIPSVVYRNSETNQFQALKDDKSIAIHPIKGSRIVDLDAFNHLLKIILQSIINANPIVTINHIPLLVVSPSLTWSRSTVEYITKFVIETLEFTAFNVVDLSIASTFGVGSSPNSVVVKVGADATQIVPVVGNQAIKFASQYLKVGGSLINQELGQILPQFSEAQIEELKTSGIYEVLNSHEGSFYSFADLKKVENSEEFDVAKMVAQTNDIKSLAEDTQEAKPNKELENNFFVSSSGDKVYVGKERFQGSALLVKAIADGIYAALAPIPDTEKRQDCYDNLIFVGATFQIPGLKEAVLYKIVEDYLVKEPSTGSANNANPDGVNPAILAYQQAEEANDDTGNNLAQVPNSVKISKYPDYFPEWKAPKETGGSWHDVYFLGAQIYAKQIFSNNSNHGRELFVDTDIYEEKGPQSIWDVSI